MFFFLATDGGPHKSRLQHRTSQSHPRMSTTTPGHYPFTPASQNLCWSLCPLVTDCKHGRNVIRNGNNVQKLAQQDTIFNKFCGVFCRLFMFKNELFKKNVVSFFSNLKKKWQELENKYGSKIEPY